jgi:hypothetical protein
MSHPSGCPYNLMRSCDNPHGFDREACGSCDSCVYSQALIDRYQSGQMSVPLAELPQETPVPEPMSTDYPYDAPQDEESAPMEEAMKAVIEEVTSGLFGHVDQKYINLDLITADLRPLVKEFLIYIKARFDANQIIDDDRCTELVSDVIHKLLDIDEADQEIASIKDLMPSLLETLNQSESA